MEAHSYNTAVASTQRLGIPRQFWTHATLIACDYLAVICIWIVAELVFTEAGLTEARWGLAAIWVLAFWREGLYPGSTHTQVKSLRAYASGSTLAGVITYAMLPLLEVTSLNSYVLVLIVTLVVVPLAYSLRLMLKRVLCRIGLWSTPVIIYGAGNTGAGIATYLQNNPLQGLRPAAFFDDNPSLEGTTVMGVPVIGEFELVEQYAKRIGSNHLIIAIPSLSQSSLLRVTSSEAQVFKNIQYVPDFPGLPLESVDTGRLDNRLTLVVRMNLRQRHKQLIKRAFDLVTAGVGVILTAPLLLILVALIRLDSAGSVLYSQSRVGRGGRAFRIWKFRSMVPNADSQLEEYLTEHPHLRQEWEANQKLEADPRVTRVGRFLRRTSLDELPQLINVFRGEMSLVGPRPIVNDEVSRYGNTIDLYSLVRPGMTGYWQVSGRSDLGYDKRVAMDAFYIRNWSIWFDIVILASTVRVVLARKGAY